MANNTESFDIIYKGKFTKIEVHHPGGQKIFRVLLEGAGPLLLNRAKKPNGTFFWTSIPEGKQKLAEEIGALIEEHIKSKT